MPKAGVGSLSSSPTFALKPQVSIHLCPKQALEESKGTRRRKPIWKFQSIYAQSRRWKLMIYWAMVWAVVWAFQSIYAQSRRWKAIMIRIRLIINLCFNPFMPKAGVGRAVGAVLKIVNIRVSIHLCPKQALEVQGVGVLFIFYLLFQSIYAQSRRWKSILDPVSIFEITVSIHLCPKQALEVSAKRFEIYYY